MNKVYGNHVGIVIQNDDPDRSGKVKVFIPHLTATVYKNWIENATNKQFKFIGSNIDSSITQSLCAFGVTENLTNIVDELRKVLPWAQCAAPLTSENSSGRYNNANDFASVSDSSFYSTFSQTTTGIATSKPGAFFESPENRLVDAFSNADENVNRPNPLAYEYIPETLSNKAKGSFGVPAVGSHVWVFFIDGNPTLPVYFAAAFGSIDWKGIYNAYNNPGIDYPEAFENRTTNTSNDETYRNKYVVNQKGGTLSISNTDLKESIKLTHYSGSFTEMNNEARIDLSTANKQELTLNDQYETVRGFRNTYTGKDSDTIIKRNAYTKIGNLDADLMMRWRDLYAVVQDNKQLFEIQRATPDNIVDGSGNIVLQRNSISQTKVGTPATHPAIGQLAYSLEDNSDVIVSQIKAKKQNISSKAIDGPSTLNQPANPPKPVAFPSLDDYTAESGIVWNNIPGESPSSENGTWNVDPAKDKVKDVISSILPELTDIERQLGPGGNEISYITKHKIETVGTTYNTFGSMRYDKMGKMLKSGLLIDKKGTYANYTPSALIELVHVQDLPGGSYILNVCNRYNLNVGAGGVNIKTLGTANFSGAVTNIAGQQVNLTSENEINVNASTVSIFADILRLVNRNNGQVFVDSNLGVDKNLIVAGSTSIDGEVFLQHITAPTEYQVTLETTSYGTVVPGVKFECMLTVPAIGPGLFAQTKTGLAPIMGSINCKATIVFTNAPENGIVLYPHSHIFKNIPLTLHPRNSEVRADAQELNNSTEKVSASRRAHGPK